MNKIIKNFISLIFIIKFIICIDVLKLNIINNSNNSLKTFIFNISNEKFQKDNIYQLELSGLISLNVSHIFIPDLEQFENKEEIDNETIGYNTSGFDIKPNVSYTGPKKIFFENYSFEIKSSYFFEQRFIFDENYIDVSFITLKDNILENAFNGEFEDIYNYSIFGLNYIDDDNFPYSFFKQFKNIEKTVVINSTIDKEQTVYIGESFNDFNNYNSKSSDVILITYNKYLYKDFGWSSEIKCLMIGYFKDTWESYNHTKYEIEKNNSAFFIYNNYQDYHIFPKETYFDYFKKKYFNLTEKNGNLICDEKEVEDKKNKNNYTAFICSEIENLVDFGLIINGTYIKFTKTNIFKKENGEYIFKIYFKNNINYAYLNINNFLEENCSIFLHVEDVDNSFFPKMKIKCGILINISKYSPYILDEKLTFKGILKLFFLGIIIFILVVVLVIAHWEKNKEKNGENNNNENYLIKHKKNI